MVDTAFLIRELGASTPVARVTAAYRLGCAGEREAVPRLLAALRDPAPEVRIAAAEALGRIGDPSAAAGLVELLGDPAPYARHAAVDALDKMGDPSLAPVLVKVLGRSDDVDLCARAVRLLLARIDTWGPEAMPGPALCQAYRRWFWRRHRRSWPRSSAPPSDGSARIAALIRSVLVQCAPPGFITILCDILLTERDRHEALSAARDLQCLAARRPCPELRAALQPLRYQLPPFRFDPPNRQQVFRTAIDQIEEATQRLSGLPVPSREPERGSPVLPRPGDDPLG